MKAFVTLSTAESKRLIAKGIVAMDVVRYAKENGIIGLARCTSNAYVAEELIGRPMKNRGAYCSGFLIAKGACALHAKYQEKLLVMVRGEERWMTWEEGNVTKYIPEMDCDDVIIKSGNVIDPHGRVGCIVAAPTGGEVGTYMPPALVKGIPFIIPMTLNKFINVPLDTMIAAMGASRIDPDRCHGLRCGMIPMPGIVVTEIDALHILSGAQATHVGNGGIGSGAGAVAIIIEGMDEQVDNAWRLVNDIREAGEEPLPDPPYNCEDCYIADTPGLGNRCSPIQALHA